MSTCDQLIVIAGGGIAGLAASIMLAQKGFQIKLFEQAKDFGETGAGIQIGPNAFGMFDHLGIREQINDLAVFPAGLVMMDGMTGDQITRIPLNDNQFKQHFTNPYAVIYRPDLHNILLQQASKFTNIELIKNCGISRFNETGTHIEITTDNGPVKSDALIGADGLWSQIRTGLFGRQKPRVSGHIAYRAILKSQDVPSQNRLNDVILWAGPKTHLVHYPLHKGALYNLVVVFHSNRYEEGWDEYGDVSELQSHFAGQHSGVLDMLAKVDSWRMWVLCDREPISNWSSNRVTLIGDAAHPTMQYLAQGACMAMEDAVCLANKLTQHVGDFKKGFQDYQNSRYLRTARVQLTSRFYGDLYHAENATADLRNSLLAKRDASAAYAGMKWLYEGVDEHGGQIL